MDFVGQVSSRTDRQTDATKRITRQYCRVVKASGRLGLATAGHDISRADNV